MTNEPLVRVEELTKVFSGGWTEEQDHVALDSVSLEIMPGRIIGLLGSNGSGKSTLLRHMIGLYLPTRGRCITLGRKASELTPDELVRIGYVHQEGTLIDWMTVPQMIRYVASYYPSWNNFLPVHGVIVGSRLAAYEREAKIQNLWRRPGWLWNATERFFLNRMKTAPLLARGRGVWGALYINVGNATPGSPVNFFLLVLLMLASTILLGYKPLRGDLPLRALSGLVIVVPFAMMAGHKMYPFTTMLLPVSRRMSFRIVLLSAFVSTVFSVLVCLVITLLSRFVDTIAHEVVFAGKNFTYAPIHPVSIAWFAILAPLMGLCQLLFLRHMIIATSIVSGIVVLIFTAAGENLLAQSPGPVVFWNSVCWLLFVLVARHCSYNRDLILKGS